MFFEREQMMASANVCTVSVNNTQAYCEDAIRQLASAKELVANTWQSDSGNAMVQALEALSGTLRSVSSQLASASSQMKSHAWGIYNSWPEDDESD